LTRLFTRFPTMTVAGDIRWRESTALHALSELPVRLA
jgi:hypothetical protein